MQENFNLNLKKNSNTEEIFFFNLNIKLVINNQRYYMLVEIQEALADSW